MNWLQTSCIAFEGTNRIAQGALSVVALACKNVVDRAAEASNPLPVLIFDESTSETIEIDWRGTQAEFQFRLGLRASQMDSDSDASLGSWSATLTESRFKPSEQAGPTSSSELVDATRKPGRPKLGVVAREVTLLPRHWEWLATQTGGASVTLRKLVEVARLSSELKDQTRTARAVAYKFMSTIAGHEVGFEEASRALFAGNQPGFEAQIVTWPKDVQTHLKALLVNAYGVKT
jgi:uncharacterized protein